MSRKVGAGTREATTLRLACHGAHEGMCKVANARVVAFANLAIDKNSTAVWAMRNIILALPNVIHCTPCPKNGLTTKEGALDKQGMEKLCKNRRRKA